MSKYLVLAIAPLAILLGIVLADSGIPNNSDWPSRLLAAHNKYRCMHGAPPLEWSDTLAGAAQQWADLCVFEHSRDRYGENIAMGFTDPEGAVKGWYDEVGNYHFTRPGFTMDTGHFTQLVWIGSRELGCGYCASRAILVCEYDPPGNYLGMFRENVLPQSRGEEECE